MNLPPNNQPTTGDANARSASRQANIDRKAFNRKKHYKSKITQTFNKAEEAKETLIKAMDELEDGNHQQLDNLYHLSHNLYIYGKQIKDWVENIDQKIRTDEKIKAATNKDALKTEIIEHIESKEPVETLQELNNILKQVDEILDAHNFDRSTASPRNDDGAVTTGELTAASEDEEELDDTQLLQDSSVVPNATLGFQDDSYRANTLGNRRITLVPRLKTVFEDSPALKSMQDAHQDEEIEQAIRATHEFKEHTERMIEKDKQLARMREEYEANLRKSVALKQAKEKQLRLEKEAKRKAELQREEMERDAEIRKLELQTQALQEHVAQEEAEMGKFSAQQRTDGSSASDYYSTSEAHEKDQRTTVGRQNNNIRPSGVKASTPHGQKQVVLNNYGTHFDKSKDTMNFEINRDSPEFSPIHNRSHSIHRPNLTRYEEDLAMEYEENPDLHDTTEVKPDISKEIDTWPTLNEAMSLLRFDGEPTRYASFIECYNNTAGQNPKFSTTTKMAVLDGALKKDARICLSAVANSEMALQKTLENLQETFGQMAGSSATLLDEIRDLPFHSYDTAIMKKDLMRHKATFDALEDFGATVETIRQAKEILRKKLPESIYTEVARFDTNNPEASLTEYVRVAKKEVMQLEMAERDKCGTYPRERNEMSKIALDVYAFEDDYVESPTRGPQPAFRKETERRPTQRPDYETRPPRQMEVERKPYTSQKNNSYGNYREDRENFRSDKGSYRNEKEVSARLPFEQNERERQLAETPPTSFHGRRCVEIRRRTSATIHSPDPTRQSEFESEENLRHLWNWTHGIGLPAALQGSSQVLVRREPLHQLRIQVTRPLEVPLGQDMRPLRRNSLVIWMQTSRAAEEGAPGDRKSQQRLKIFSSPQGKPPIMASRPATGRSTSKTRCHKLTGQQHKRRATSQTTPFPSPILH